METEKRIYEFAGGEVSIQVDQETIHLKAISGRDPAELTESEALEIAQCLQRLVHEIRSQDNQK